MKKTILGVLLVTALLGTPFLFSCGAGNGGGDCVFDRQDPQDFCLKTEATCTSPAVYYYTCTCGQKGTETFLAGEVVPHAYGADELCTVCGEHRPTEGLAFEKRGVGYVVVGIGSATEKDIYIPSAHEGLPVTGIGTAAFEDCEALTSVTIGNGVTSIGDLSFFGCTKLTRITMGDSVTHIGRQAFSHCTGLTEIVLPDSVTNIGLSAFAGCNSLKSVVIGKGVTRISRYVFEYCEALTRVTLSNSVTRIDSCAFYKCTGLTDVYFAGTEEEWNAIEKGYMWSYDAGHYTLHKEDKP